MLQRSRKRLGKRAKKGFRGYPVATVALYGPDDTTATKLAVGIVPAENSEVTDLRRWLSEGSDIRNDVDVTEQVLAFIADFLEPSRSRVSTTKGPPAPIARSGPRGTGGPATGYSRHIPEVPQATCSGKALRSKTVMPYAIIRGRNGRRHEVDFGDATVRVQISSSEETVEIFIEADFQALPEERRRFAILNVPRHQFSEATGAAARRAAQYPIAGVTACGAAAS